MIVHLQSLFSQRVGDAADREWFTSPPVKDAEKGAADVAHAKLLVRLHDGGEANPREPEEHYNKTSSSFVMMPKGASRVAHA